jgi:DNA-binding beta-propeller fold protein YncE
LLVTDTGNHRLQVIDQEGNFIEAIGNQGNLPGQFYEPVGISLSADGQIYMADTWNGRIQHLNSDMLPVNEWSVDAWLGESINNKPYLAVDKIGQIYVTDPEGYRVIIFDGEGQYLGRFGQYSLDTDGFGLPTGIKFDSDGNFYIADAGNSRILKYPPVESLSSSVSSQE